MYYELYTLSSIYKWGLQNFKSPHHLNEVEKLGFDTSAETRSKASWYLCFQSCSFLQSTLHSTAIVIYLKRGQHPTTPSLFKTFTDSTLLTKQYLSPSVRHLHWPHSHLPLHGTCPPHRIAYSEALTNSPWFSHARAASHCYSCSFLCQQQPHYHASSNGNNLGTWKEAQCLQEALYELLRWTRHSLPPCSC